jgi:hypothetical protein
MSSEDTRYIRNAHGSNSRSIHRNRQKLPGSLNRYALPHEADTLATCISKARRALNEHNIPGEIIIADNGSTDESQAIARKLRARVVKVREREDMVVPSWVASQWREES